MKRMNKEMNINKINIFSEENNILMNVNEKQSL